MLAKYLKDRKGRELSWQEVEHFRRVVKAVEKTRVVQGVVEEVKVVEGE